MPLRKARVCLDCHLRRQRPHHLRGKSKGQFAILDLQSDPPGTVTRLHMTFEQTCADYATLRPAGGQLTGDSGS
jgi:hypothetical protein